MIQVPPLSLLNRSALLSYEQGRSDRRAANNSQHKEGERGYDRLTSTKDSPLSSVSFSNNLQVFARKYKATLLETLELI